MNEHRSIKRTVTFSQSQMESIGLEMDRTHMNFSQFLRYTVNYYLEHRETTNNRERDALESVLRQLRELYDREAILLESQLLITQYLLKNVPNEHSDRQDAQQWFNQFVTLLIEGVSGEQSAAQILFNELKLRRKAQEADQALADQLTKN
jgi:hypothetical protein